MPASMPGITPVPDSPEGSSTSKRAREIDLDDEFDAEDVQMPASTRSAAGSGSTRQRAAKRRKSRVVNGEDGEEGEDGNVDADVQDEEDDAAAEAKEQEFENQHREQIIKDLEERLKVQGGIADYGILEHIEMHQFMCHRQLSFKLGPQINFIIGHNGSGKSAVLSAITVALGGKAHSTGRGTGLKSFIREGQSAAEVSVTLKNRGEEAYKPHEYGESITITRRFTKDGASSWKIKDKDKRVVSTKREELAAICDHMNIQVDNPMTVLTQDAARQFLSASTPQDKYKFFLRGTQLSQLAEEYETCLDHIRQTSKVLNQKKEALPELKSAFREISLRFEEAKKAREQKKKADELKKELAWAHVKAKENEFRAQADEAAKLARVLPKLQANIEKAQAELQEVEATFTAQEQEVAMLGDQMDLQQEKDRLQEELKHNRGLLNDFGADLKRMDQSLKATNKQIAELDAQIEAEERRMASHNQAKLDASKRKLEEARERVKTAETGLERIREQKRIQHEKNEALKKEGMQTEEEQNKLKVQVQQCEELLNRSIEAEKNNLAPYGNNIKGVLAQIAQMNWYGDIPLGPLGLYVKARDPRKWGELLRQQLGNYLTAFAVTNHRDRESLRQLLDRAGNQNTQIIIYEKDLFEYGNGEPPEHLLTVIRALEITDPYVLRILINRAGIERQILAVTRVEAENVMKGLRGGGQAWTTDGFMVRVFPEGGSSSNPIHFKKANDATNLLLTGRDAASEVQHHRGRLAECERNYQAIAEQIRGMRESFGAGKRALDALTADEIRAGDVLRRARMAVSNLQQEANEEMPTGIVSFQVARTEAVAEKDAVLAQSADVMRQKAVIDAKQADLLTKMNNIRAQLGEHAERKKAIVSRMEDTIERRTTIQNGIRHYGDKLTQEQLKVRKAQEHVEVLQQEFTNWTSKAEEYCAQVENPRSVEVVQRQLNSVQEALKEREKRHGATVEEMTIEVNRAKAQLDAVEKDLKQMAVLTKTLKGSLNARLQRWEEFRRHIALRCKLVFQFHLSHRGYFGKVLFNHGKGSLQLKVQTDDQIATQGGRDKDPRSLSGGEKSFSTICLLLSLWESIGCPLRCLDEFDVFMDAVNRRISMKMMIDTANSSDKKQYILITPQDMNNVHLGPTVRIHRMTDPERGQASLPSAYTGQS